MTRLEASNEPSMEDILASIRKIIAEDPPGSRPVPPQPAARAAPAASPAPSSFGRSPTREVPAREAADRETMAREAMAREPQFSSEPIATPTDLGPEPYLRATPAKPETSSFGSAPFFMPKGEPKPAASRIEPSFASMSAAVPATAPSAIFDAIPEPSQAALSVEAQLSDLLDDVALAPSPLTAEPAEAVAPQSPTPVETSKPTVDFAARLIGRPSPAPANVVVQAEVRPGFSVSRDGFVPESAGAIADPLASADAAISSGADSSRDPFDFDLGPSPFELKAATVESARAAPLNEGTPAQRAEPEAAPESAPAGAVAEPIAGREEPAADLNFVSGPLPYVAPSVEATVQPSAPTPEPEPEPEMVIQESEPAVIEEVVPELEPYPIEDSQAHTLSGTEDAVFPAGPAETATSALAQSMQTSSMQTSSLRTSAQTSPVQASSMQLSLASAAQRTMEDTVADLLRPMLKSWLTENMPKIVERALRRELTEQLHSEHKAAAE